MNEENCALKLIDEIILYYDARSKEHQIDLLCRLKMFERMLFLEVVMVLHV